MSVDDHAARIRGEFERASALRGVSTPPVQSIVRRHYARVARRAGVVVTAVVLGLVLLVPFARVGVQSGVEMTPADTAPRKAVVPPSPGSAGDPVPGTSGDSAGANNPVESSPGALSQGPPSRAPSNPDSPLGAPGAPGASGGPAKPTTESVWPGTPNKQTTTVPGAPTPTTKVVPPVSEPELFSLVMVLYNPDGAVPAKFVELTDDNAVLTALGPTDEFGRVDVRLRLGTYQVAARQGDQCFTGTLVISTEIVSRNSIEVYVEMTAPTLCTKAVTAKGIAL